MHVACYSTRSYDRESFRTANLERGESVGDLELHGTVGAEVKGPFQYDMLQSVRRRVVTPNGKGEKRKGARV